MEKPQAAKKDLAASAGGVGYLRAGSCSSTLWWGDALAQLLTIRVALSGTGQRNRFECFWPCRSSSRWVACTSLPNLCGCLKLTDCGRRFRCWAVAVHVHGVTAAPLPNRAMCPGWTCRYVDASNYVSKVTCALGGRGNKVQEEVLVHALQHPMSIEAWEHNMWHRHFVSR